MSNPVSSNNPLGGARPPVPASTARLPDNAAVDQSAAEFAALLGAEPPREPTRSSDDESSMSGERSESSESSGESRAENRDGDGRVARRERRGDSDEGQSGDEEGTQESAMPSFGDAILEGLSKAAGTVAVEAPASVEGGGFDQVVQQICDRILVSDPGTGPREVRIMLKDSVLPGTEIRLVQEAGRLQVQFITDHADTGNRLAQHQAALQSLLSEKLSGQEVVVEVTMDTQGQDMGDGRSRQQRDAREEYEQQVEAGE